MKKIIFIILSITLSGFVLHTNCDSCLINVSTPLRNVHKVPIFYQSVSLIGLLGFLYFTFFVKKEKLLKFVLPLSMLFMFLFILSNHALVDSILQEELRNTWFGFTIEKIHSSPADPVHVCIYEYPFIEIKDDLEKSIKIFVGVYPYMFDVEGILKECKRA